MIIIIIVKITFCRIQRTILWLSADSYRQLSADAKMLSTRFGGSATMSFVSSPYCSGTQQAALGLSLGELRLDLGVFRLDQANWGLARRTEAQILYKELMFSPSAQYWLRSCRHSCHSWGFFPGYGDFVTILGNDLSMRGKFYTSYRSNNK